MDKVAPIAIHPVPLFHPLVDGAPLVDVPVAMFVVLVLDGDAVVPPVSKNGDPVTVP